MGRFLPKDNVFELLVRLDVDEAALFGTEDVPYCAADTGMLLTLRI